MHRCFENTDFLYYKLNYRLWNLIENVNFLVYIQVINMHQVRRKCYAIFLAANNYYV